VHTIGGVVTPAQPLAIVVPRDSELEIEAMVSNRDIGFVSAEQDAEIKVDAFNFTRYGLSMGWCSAFRATPSPATNTRSLFRPPQLACRAPQVNPMVMSWFTPHALYLTAHRWKSKANPSSFCPA
jgi:hypothetical protein